MRRLLAIAAAVALVACRKRVEPSVSGERPAGATAVTSAQSADDGQWTMPAKDYANRRYSQLADITATNVASLRLVWTRKTGVERGHEAAPLVVGSTMYVVTPYPNLLHAFDLTKPGSAPKWTYTPPTLPAAQGVACCDVVNRGASFADGRIHFNTLDAQSVAVDAESGKEIWRTKLGDITRGETITMAPLVVKGKVLVGNSGGELGVRGWLTALDAKTGEVAWKAYSTGPDADVLIGPDFHPHYASERGQDLGVTTWPVEHWKIGGGTVWGFVSYDPELECRRSPSAVVAISSEESGEISLIDPETDRVTKTIPVGKRPRGIKASPDGKTLYVAVSGSTKNGPRDDAADGIAVVDIERGAVVRRLDGGRDPEAFDLTPDGKRLFVSNEETAQVTEMDIESGRVLRRIDVGREPEGVTYANGEIFVTSEEDSRVDVISDAEHRVVRSIPTPRRPRAVAVVGGEAFVTSENDGVVAVLGERSVKGTIALGPGARPMGITVDGDRAFVSNGRGKTVSVIDLRDRSVVATMAEVGPRAWGLGAYRDKLYVAAGSDVAVVSISQRAVLSRVSAGRGTWGVVVVPRSR